MDSHPLLAQLRPNHLPDAVGFWPPAPGWWLLAVAVSCGVVWGVRRFIRYRRQNRYRRQGLRQAQRIKQQYHAHGDQRVLVHDYNRLLKQVALQAYPQHRVAGLSGQRWMQFLVQSCGNIHAYVPALTVLDQERFQATTKTLNNTTVATLHEVTRRWIKRHRVNIKHV